MGLGDTEYKGPFQSLAIYFTKNGKKLRKGYENLFLRQKTDNLGCKQE